MAFGSALSVEVDSTSARKSRGAFFTPPLLTEYICRWAIRSKTDKVLEPACGEAEFLLAAAHRFEEIGLGRSCLKENLTGLELHAESVIEARKRMAASGVSCNVMKGDYLLSDFEGCFDAVVGNPPYVRFQSLDRTQKEGCRRVSQKSGVEISALSSLWVPFVIQSALSLKSGGRIGLCPSFRASIGKLRCSCQEVPFVVVCRDQAHHIRGKGVSRSPGGSGPSSCRRVREGRIQ